jgi:hypothetical protein
MGCTSTIDELNKGCIIHINRRKNSSDDNNSKDEEDGEKFRDFEEIGSNYK